jgi:hypothetical protein
MRNRNLTPDELKASNRLLKSVRVRLLKMSCDDPELLFAFRRKLWKELNQDERKKAGHRNQIKKLKRQEQNGLCPLCHEALPLKYCHLHRLSAADGYTVENTQLIHRECHERQQAERNYT